MEDRCGDAAVPVFSDNGQEHDQTVSFDRAKDQTNKISGRALR